MFLERFFKPKWQHPNPQVRKQALLKLSSRQADQQALLLELAAGDPADEVRRSAVKRVSDLDFLRRRADEDADAGVREVASARYRQLLAGGTEADDLPLRLAQLALCTDAPVIAYVARRGREVELRLAALARIDAESVLEDVALNDASPKIRQSAASRLRDPDTLERVLRHSKERDRKVWRLVRDALDVRQAAAEAERRDHVEQERIAEALAALAGSPAREGYAAEMQRLRNRWQAIASAASPQTQVRFDAAIAGCAEQLAAEASRPIEPAPSVEPPPSVGPAAPDPALSALLDAVVAAPPIDAAGLAELEAALAALAPAADGDQRRRVEPLRRQLAVARAVIGREPELQTALGEARGIEPHDAAALVAAARRLRRLLDRLPWDLPWPAPPLLAAARAELEALTTAGERAAASRQAELDGAWAQLEQQLAGGHLRDAQRLLAKAQKILEQLPAPARPPQERRLKSYQGKVAELRDWRRFATLPKQAELCERMEALIERELAPPERAEQVRALQEAWKATGGSDSAEAQQLWERFRSAGDKAFEPCRGYFSELAQQRERNLAERRRIGEQLAAFVAQADWERVELDALVSIRGQARREWQAAVPIERKANEPVQNRFESLMDDLSRRIRDRQDALRQQKQALVIEAQSLAGLDDPRAATERVKQLQSSWQRIGPLPAALDRKLWREFRAACDGAFERRQQARQQSDQEHQANLLQAEAVCLRLEALVGEAAGEQESEPARLRELEAAFEAVGTLPRQQAAALRQRFRAARRSLLDRWEERARSSARLAQAAAGARAGLCARLEAAVIAAEPARLAELLPEWEASGAPPAALADALDRRWQRAVAAAEAGGFEAEAIETAQRRRQQLCIRMEILAGVDSPEAERPLRMDLQVRRLSEGMSEGRRLDQAEEAQALRREWLETGPVAQPEDALDQRFEKALEGLRGSEANRQAASNPPENRGEARAKTQRGRDAKGG